MFSALKGGPLWATVGVVVAYAAGATVLAFHGTISGAEWLAATAPIITGGAAIGGVHVASNAIAANQVSQPGPGSVTNGPPSPVPAANSPTSAMPTGA